MSYGKRSIAVATILHVSIGCALAAILVDAWFVSGLISPVVVASGSMAPALLGPHRAWTCVGCPREFVCEAEALPATGLPAVCPYCRAANDADAGIDRSGDRVWIDRSAFTWRAPRRGEVIVLERPDMPRAWCVKRVAGLPGEHVEMRAGEVRINDQIASVADLQEKQIRINGRQLRYRLGPDEYFVLGDNRPHSQDSRSWPERGVRAEQIVGRVLRW